MLRKASFFALPSQTRARDVNGHSYDGGCCGGCLDGAAGGTINLMDDVVCAADDVRNTVKMSISVLKCPIRDTKCQIRDRKCPVWDRNV